MKNMHIYKNNNINLSVGHADSPDYKTFEHGDFQTASTLCC